MANLTILSFGYLHEVPDATMTVDLRQILRDPHIDPALRAKDARDAEVFAKVAGTFGALELADRLREVGAVLSMLAQVTGHPTTLAIGCAGGRHRSAALAMLIADELTAEGHEVTVTHLHVDRPVVARS
ncbi:RapZ C-terminal domain-containing protein [Actinospica robiniae]|uniref:RapZ C-terminal domain-containing protein n=1 Tax=Actinospica robiniae TaxID=304901 RepID=UPI0003FA9F9E|nr:RNase adapter RapZ [Actinospica robiniae]